MGIASSCDDDDKKDSSIWQLERSEHRDEKFAQTLLTTVWMSVP